MAKPASGTGLATTSLTSGLVAAWVFNENTGTPIELVGNHAASASANFSWGTGPNGPIGLFTGNTDLTYNAVPSFGPALSIAAGGLMTTVSGGGYTWIERESVNSSWQVFSIGSNLDLGGGDNQYRCQLSESGEGLTDGTYFSWCIADNGTGDGTGTAAIPYFNGTAVTNYATGGTPAVANTNSIHIGNLDGSIYYFNGSIDYIYVWNRQITGTEAGLIHTDPWQILAQGTTTTGSAAAIIMDF